MKFFIPNTDNSEEVYKSIVLFIESMGHKVLPYRIHSILFNHDTKEYNATIDEVFIRNKEKVIAIFKTDELYLICTYSRGVAKGEPILVGNNELISVTFFEEE